MTRKEFLEDTVAYYSADPVGRRAVVKEGIIGLCYYRHPDDPSKRCAAGRWIPDEKYDVSLEKKVVDTDEVFVCLEEEVQKLGKAFVRDVQYLHDGSVHWNDEGLSEEGKEYLASIEKKVLLDHYN